jgi:iron-sulfur cluster assembly protein
MDLKKSAQIPTETEGIRITPAAAKKVKEIVQQQGFEGETYLFMGVKGGGCSGLQYVLDIRDAAQAPPYEGDEVFLTNDIVVVCDLKSYIVGNLSGTELDYEENLMQSGFLFKNPNAKHKCGCGQSYAV